MSCDCCSKPKLTVVATVVNTASGTITFTLNKPLNRVGFKRKFIMCIPIELLKAFPVGDAEFQIIVTDNEAAGPYNLTDTRGDYVRLDSLLTVECNSCTEAFDAYFSNDPLHVGVLDCLPRSCFEILTDVVTEETEG